MSGVDESDNAARQCSEIALLEAMYPTEFSWDSKSTPEVPSFHSELTMK